MSWLGQHIWGFISRFRNKIYIETIETGTSDKVLVRETDGLVKQKDCKCAKGDEVKEVRGTSPIQVDNTDVEKPVVSVDAASGSSRGTMTAADFTKLAGVATGATRNVGEVKEVKGTAPVSVDATDPEKPVVSVDSASRTATGLMTKTEYIKLEGVAAGADVTPTWVPAKDPSYLTTTVGFSGTLTVLADVVKGVNSYLEIAVVNGLIISTKTVTKQNAGGPSVSTPSPK
tara:strand:+ start:216 stop:905 length:690 start_codon:yes stop_codon:yes gene_type:complete